MPGTKAWKSKWEEDAPASFSNILWVLGCDPESSHCPSFTQLQRPLHPVTWPANAGHHQLLSPASPLHALEKGIKQRFYTVSSFAAVCP